MFLCSITFRVAAYTSPFILCYCYKRGCISLQAPFVNFSEVHSFARIILWMAAGYAVAMLGRGVGRFYNHDYQTFITLYSKMIKLPAEDFRKQKPLLHAYDFDFDFWPVEYRWKNSTLADLKRPPEPLQTKESKQSSSFPYNILGYLAIQTFGKRMMYPGTVGLLQFMMNPVIQDGRRSLIDDHHGVRYKLQTNDDNYIDTMYVKNTTKDSNGTKLVVCCEGNAGFYEIGIMNTAIAAGYSVLGWNHPGFGGSTGFPHPENEVNAVDTVMKFAIERLGYKQSNIIVFAWSIGGYPASWVTMNYPEIRGVILDATFDDVVELAVAKMPSNWKSLVIGTVRQYFNLNVSEQLKYYHGPIRLIRRTKDEIINTDPDEPIKTNRSNQILIRLFKERFPKLMKDKKVEESLIGWLQQERKRMYLT
jgi:pimeloyl-ACP methyl ester carboxylesterase